MKNIKSNYIELIGKEVNITSSLFKFNNIKVRNIQKTSLKKNSIVEISFKRFDGSIGMVKLEQGDFLIEEVKA